LAFQIISYGRLGWRGMWNALTRGEMRGEFCVLGWGKCQFGRPRSRWEQNVVCNVTKAL